MNAVIQWLWYKNQQVKWLLWPLSLVYRVIISIRRVVLVKKQYHCAVPIIVVGNITVGGTGKTPLVIALVHQLQSKGLKVGVVSRGYKAKIKHFPHEIMNQDNATMVGDEPLLIAQKTQVPVVIDSDRVAAVKYLLAHHACQVIVSDDGLQHYALGRAIEIAVIDGLDYFGNGACLPAGPLRESINRLKKVDFIIVNQGSFANAYCMNLVPQSITALSPKGLPFNSHSSIAAVAGIGKPQRFFNTLLAMNLNFKSYIFPNHYPFKAKDFNFSQSIIVMTEKDAVKCTNFAENNWYYLPVIAQVESDFWEKLWTHPRLKSLL